MSYNFQAIEPHWQNVWEREGALNVRSASNAPDVYILSMFPGPSGPLHMGHAKNYVIGDVLMRYRIRKGDNVFHPMGWDAFGLPAEIAAIKHNVHPRDWTEQHIDIQKRQFRSLGIHHDWSHEINTSVSDYYRWNQWLFLKLHERGLAYQAERAVNWCPQCQTTLANEEVIEETCERCDTPIIQKPLNQWFLKITAYADALLDGLDKLPDWPRRMRTIQRNWIGRSENGETVTYNLRDWCISRQRYWGTPIPIVHCKTCGTVPVPETELPVQLPHMADFEPDGQSPLARVSEFVQTVCPSCGQPARRETDTMTGFVCSAWYFLRFASPNTEDRPFDSESVHRWMPMAHYIGGKEHAVGHLMYARFITRFLKDIGHIDFSEPFTHLFNQGVVYKDGAKMSKSRGNVVSIEQMTQTYGADTARMFVLFATPTDRDMDWNDDGVQGIHRFLHRVWQAITGDTSSQSAENGDLMKIAHRTIRAVTQDLERLHYNTAISRLMELTTAIQQQGASSEEIQHARETLVLLIAPFAPHIAESLWRHLGHTDSVHLTSWPTPNSALAARQTVSIAVQINGKTRDVFDAPHHVQEDDIIQVAKERKRIRKHLENHVVHRTVYVPNRLINFVL